MTKVLRFTDREKDVSWKRPRIQRQRRVAPESIRRFSTIQNNGKRLLNVSQCQSNVAPPPCSMDG